MVYWIMIEGPDNIGKTRLISMLQNKKGIISEASHFGAPTSKNPQKEQKELAYDTLEYIKHQAKYYKGSNLLILHDRSIFGELVYSKYRNYTPTYFHDIIKKMNNINNLRVLMIILYADNSTYKKFSIKQKNEVHHYENIDQSEQISIDFINKLHTLDGLKILTINSNNYDSFEQRNDTIIKYVTALIKNESMKFRTSNNYKNTPFNPDNILLEKDDWHDHLHTYQCASYEKEECALGLQHKTCIYGKEYDQPTYAIGTNISQNLKYIFVGEAPGRNGCGTFGIPFYGDPSGNLFLCALWTCDINLFNCYITNLIKCCPENNALGMYKKMEERLKLECIKQLKYDLINLNYDMKFTKLIAVGRIAHNTLLKLGFQPALLLHPAFYLRIGMAHKFIESLKEIIKKTV